MTCGSLEVRDTAEVLGWVRPTEQRRPATWGLNGPLVVGLCAAAIPLATRRVADSDRRPCEIVSSNTRDSQAEARTLKELLDDVR